MIFSTIVTHSSMSEYTMITIITTDSCQSYVFFYILATMELSYSQNTLKSSSHFQHERPFPNFFDTFCLFFLVYICLNL